MKQFTRSKPHAHNPNTRKLLSHIHKKHKLDHNATRFTPSQVHKVIKDMKNSTAPSADGLNINPLKHLSPLGIQYLCCLYNFISQHATLLAIWKHAITLPILKPGKNLKQRALHIALSHSSVQHLK